MRVFDKDKKNEIENPNLEKGFLVDDELVTHHDAVQAVEEQGHYETIREYPNGGKDVEWHVDVQKVEGKEAYDEVEPIQVYIPYTEEELRKIEKEKTLEHKRVELNSFKNNIAQIDYKTIKYIEGELTEEEFELHKIEKQTLRKKIKELETEIEELEREDA